MFLGTKAPNLGDNVDADDFLAEFNFAPKKPQVTPEASFVGRKRKKKVAKTKTKVEYKLRETTKPKPKKVEYDESLEVKWTKVSARTRKPKCGWCRNFLKPHSYHWMAPMLTEENELKPHWWCVKCLEDVLTPPKQHK